VGDVGRPDLLEKAAGLVNTMEKGARQLFHSVARLREMPDYLQIWLGHSAGSACGKGLGAVPQSSLGYEKLTNWALLCSDEEKFVATVLEGQPEPPRYFAQMKCRNRRGPDPIPREQPPVLTEEQLSALLAQRAWVIDARPLKEEDYFPGSLRIPAGKGFTNWAGWLTEYDQPLYLISDEPGVLIQQLQAIGLDRVEGVIGSALQLPCQPIRRYNAQEFRELGGSHPIVDLRGAGERQGGWIPGSVALPLGYLAERFVRAERPPLLHCQSGYRSIIGVSLLDRLGYSAQGDLRGGFPVWPQAGFPIETSSSARPTPPTPVR
jgi:hydroxyacylglutathione hydrolase